MLDNGHENLKDCTQVPVWKEHCRQRWPARELGAEQSYRAAALVIFLEQTVMCFLVVSTKQNSKQVLYEHLILVNNHVSLPPISNPPLHKHTPIYNSDFLKSKNPQVPKLPNAIAFYCTLLVGPFCK